MNLFDLISNGLLIIVSLGTIGLLLRTYLRRIQKEEPAESEGQAFDILIRRKMELIQKIEKEDKGDGKGMNLFALYKKNAEQASNDPEYLNVTKLMLELQWGSGPFIGEIKNELSLPEDDRTIEELAKALFAHTQYPIKLLPKYNQIKTALITAGKLTDRDRQLSTLLESLQRQLPPLPG